MKKILAGLFIVFLLQHSAYATDRIRIGLPERNIQLAPLPLAATRGFFEEEGLQVEFVQMASNVGIAALVSGGVDYWSTSGNLVTTAVLRGAPIKIVACYVPRAPFSLISRPEFKSVQELKGQAFGINAFGNALETIAKLMFKHFGIDADRDVKFLITGGNEGRFASMQQRITAATIVSPPIDLLGRNLGFVVLARSQELFNYPTSGVVANAKKISLKPDEVKRVIRAGLKANRYIRENRAGTVQFIAEWLKTDEKMAAATYESTSKIYNEDGAEPEDGLRFLIEESKKLVKVNREVALSEVEDLSILRQAARELGINEK